MNFAELDNRSLTNSPHFNLDRISYSWPSGKKALDKCSLDIPGSGLWMIVGSNGSGKTTLFRIISGMLKPDSGQIHCPLKVALMFQNPDHHLLLPTCRSDLAFSLPNNLNLKERRDRINYLLNLVGLEGMASRPIHTLSGGQKQRLSLASALASDAKLLLLDEPTALLDPTSQKKVLNIVQELCHWPGEAITAIWITHRLEELEYCDGAMKMEQGSLGPIQKGHNLTERLNLLAAR
tara:strand:+ start:276 stop:983 length:708 start_codon:yes stop_codon:yes gene_type:complete